MKVQLDDSEARALAADMREYPARLQRHVRDVVTRGAANIKRDLRAQMGASRHFKGISRSIDYDVRPFGFGNRGGYEAEIGPRKGSGEAGALANIAYFGSSRGGGTVEDPARALEREAPGFERALGNLMEELFP